MPGPSFRMACWRRPLAARRPMLSTHTTMAPRLCGTARSGRRRGPPAPRRGCWRACGTRTRAAWSGLRSWTATCYPSSSCASCRPWLPSVRPEMAKEIVAWQRRMGQRRRRRHGRHRHRHHSRQLSNSILKRTCACACAFSRHHGSLALSPRSRSRRRQRAPTMATLRSGGAQKWRSGIF